MFEFTITGQDGKARTGELVTPHGTVTTPMFMPVGTHGAVKSVSPSELKGVGSQTILANTYHMYLRPGDGLVKDLGGLHEFMRWNGPILTDSGGFQVFSLGERGMAGNEKAAMRKVAEEGITFQSHLDGSKHLFTPEKSIEIQQNLGADIIMAFDQPVYGMSSEAAAKEAMERSMRWLERSATQWKAGEAEKQGLFGIVQGGVHAELHLRSAEHLAGLDLPGNAIGGLSVGEEKERMWEAVESINAVLPIEKPRYFMGLGEPRDLIDAVLRGVDMFDCVSPSRLARHGAVWVPQGSDDAVRAFYSSDVSALAAAGGVRFKRLNLHNSRFKDDARPLRDIQGSMPEGLAAFSMAALNHYLKEREMLGYRILTLHNIEILHTVVQLCSKSVREGRMEELSSAVK